LGDEVDSPSVRAPQKRYLNPNIRSDKVKARHEPSIALKTTIGDLVRQHCDVVMLAATT
jgi:hypothetical protein